MPTMLGTAVPPAPSIAPRPTPVSLTFSGPGNEPAPVERTSHLPGGIFQAKWSITPSGDCGATIDVYRVPDDGFAWSIAGVLVDQPLSRTETSGSLPAGEYEMWAHVGCRWSITISGPTNASSYSVTRSMIKDQKLTWDAALNEPLTTITFGSDTSKVASAAVAIGSACKTAAAWIDTHPNYDPAFASAVSFWRQAVSAYDQGSVRWSCDWRPTRGASKSSQARAPSFGRRSSRPSS